jgi:hypothetical protein
VKARATEMLSSTASGSTPKRALISAMRSGRNVPSVSMYMTLPFPPPEAVGSCAVTHRVWHSLKGRGKNAAIVGTSEKR